MSAPTFRLIDAEKSTRTKPMRVLVLGVSRTGTLSMYYALQKLGFKPYHMAEGHNRPKRDFGLWVEALRAKLHGEGEPYGRLEFDKLMGDFDAVSDLPSILFTDELLTAYPDAKVILTLRAPDSWLASMQRTVYRVQSWRSWPLVAPYDRSWVGPWYALSCQMLQDFVRSARTDYLSPAYGELARARFVEHYEHVRSVVPAERLLEYRPQDGWGPLCGFLEVAPPPPLVVGGSGEAYPNSNDSGGFVYYCTILWYIAAAKMLAKTVLPAAIAVGGVLVYRWKYGS